METRTSKWKNEITSNSSDDKVLKKNKLKQKQQEI